MQRLGNRKDGSLAHLGEINQTQRQTQQIAAGNTQHHGRGRNNALAPLHKANHQRQHKACNGQITHRAIAAAAHAARGPVHSHGCQRQTDHGHHHTGHGMWKKAADHWHEKAANNHHQRAHQRGAQNAGHAMLHPHADACADKRKARAHHTGQANTDRADATALDDGDDARPQQRCIDQGYDLICRQLERTTKHQWHRDDAAQCSQQMLQGQQGGGHQTWRTIFHSIKQLFHGFVSCLLVFISRG